MAPLATADPNKARVMAPLATADPHKARVMAPMANAVPHNLQLTTSSYYIPPGGGYCHTKAVGVCHQSPMEHMEREREKSRNVESTRDNY